MAASTSDDTPTARDEPSQATDTPLRSMRSTLRGVATVVAPSSLVIALLYYFGWARTQAQAHAMGLDDSLFGFSTQDYVLRSISSMFWPVFLGALAVLAGLLLHGALTAWLRGSESSMRVDQDETRVLWIFVSAGAIFAVVLLVLGAIGANVDAPSRFVSLGSPLAVTIGIVVLGYAAYLHQAYLARRRGAGSAAIGPLAWSVICALLLLSLFWTVSHYAAIRGIDLADEAQRRLPSQPSVTIYSASRLYLMPPVQERQLPDESAAYRYEYTGLKLLFRSEGKFFLRPADRSSSRNIIIAESGDVRLEFDR